jgi:hypothetical protein
VGGQDFSYRRTAFPQQSAQIEVDDLVIDKVLEYFSVCIHRTWGCFWRVRMASGVMADVEWWLRCAIRRRGIAEKSQSYLIHVRIEYIEC